MARGIGRRQFMSALGGTAVAWPLAARAQKSVMPVVGVLSGSSAAERVAVLTAFRQGLNEIGYVEGQNVTIEYRFAEGQYDRMPTFLADFIQRPVTVIFAGDGPSALAAQAATTTIPIIFNSGGDAVQIGLVANLGRPTANLTGVSLIVGPLSSKQFALLHELVPSAKTLAFLINPQNANAKRDIAAVQEAASVLGLHALILSASTKGDLETAFATLVQEKGGALLVNADVFFTSQRDQLVTMAARQAVPAIYVWREFCEAGGLISYGPSLAGGYRQCGLYVGRVLNGAKPSDLPVIQPTKFELVINLKTAKALGLTLPLIMQMTADEVIE
jgi:putative tryptophan/tyrosine transport system substrate-binding protein